LSESNCSIDAGSPGARRVCADGRCRGQGRVRQFRSGHERSPPAKKAQQKLEKEFEKRDQELQRLAKQLQGMQEALEKNGMTMAEGERRNKEREFNELNRDFQRKQREFREDLNQRRNEELAGVLERANKTIRRSPRPRSTTSSSRKRFTPARASTSPTR
jgi:SMC interacting uncharacterized protein involved in chromosome segregation